MRHVNPWLYERIKVFREQAGMTQAELARKLNLTRASVNAWEMGLSVPSAQSIIDLAKVFHVSTDTILGVDSSYMIDISDLTAEQARIVALLVQHFNSENIKSD